MRRPFIGAERLEALKDRKLAAQPGKETSFPGLPSGERSKGALRTRYREFYLDKIVYIFTLKIRFSTCPEFRYQFSQVAPDVRLELTRPGYQVRILRLIPVSSKELLLNLRHLGLDN